MILPIKIAKIAKKIIKSLEKSAKILNCSRIANKEPIFKERKINDGSIKGSIWLLPVLGKLFERLIFTRARSYEDKFCLNETHSLVSD